MTAILLTIHTLIVLGLIVVVLLQRSDGGALGIGGGGGGGLMSGRGAANALTRTTSLLAAIFISTSLGLAVLAGSGESDDAGIQDVTNQQESIFGDPDAEPSTDDLMDTLGAETEEGDTAADPDSLLDSLGAEEAETPTAPAPDADTSGESIGQSQPSADETSVEATDGTAGDDAPEDEQPEE